MDLGYIPYEHTMQYLLHVPLESSLNKYQQTSPASNLEDGNIHQEGRLESTLARRSQQTF